jgi:hypothetical protein
MGNLQPADRNDLPLATQRSDDWKMKEVPDKYVWDPTVSPREYQRKLKAQAQRDLRLDDTQRRLVEAQTFIAKNQEKYEKDRAAAEEEKARNRERLEGEGE